MIQLISLTHTRSPMTINANELLEIDAPSPEPIWGPGFCTRNLTMVYGTRGVAKTRWAMKLAHTIAAGGKFLCWAVGDPRRVLYIDGELGLPSLRNRYRAIEAEAALSPEGDYFRVLSKDHCGHQLWNISNPKDQAKYDAAIGNAEVVIFDNLLSCMFPMDGKDDEVAQWRRVAPWLFHLREAGKLVILIHHTGKSGEQLGSSVKENFLDTCILLKKCQVERNIDGCEFDFIWTKTRDVKKSEAPNLHIELLDDDEGTPRWYWSSLGEEREQSIKNMKAMGISKRDAARELNLTLLEVSKLWGSDE